MHLLRAALPLIASIVVCWTSTSALAQCELQWDDQFALAGANSQVFDSVVFDSGDGPMLYVGGSFSQISGNTIQGIARYDGANWHALGSGLDGGVRAMAVFDDGRGPALYVTGDFTQAGGQPAQRLARWDGRAWSSVGGGANNTVIDLYVSEAPTGTPRLYAMGIFSSIGGVAINRLAAFDGSQWSAVTPPEFTFTTTMVAHDDPATSASDLVLTGSRPNPDPKVPEPQEGLFRFDGVDLTFITGSINPAEITRLLVYDDGDGEMLYAGGSFTQTAGSDPTPCRGVARLDGDKWIEVGGGVNNMVLDMFVFDDGTGPGLYVGGSFSQAGTIAAGCAARWNGVNWSPLTTGVSFGGTFTWVRGFTAWDDGFGPSLIVHGDFSRAGDRFARCIARWDGVSWSALGRKSGIPGVVNDMLVIDTDPMEPRLIVATDTAVAGDSLANRVAAWDGTRFTALGPGFNQRVCALAMFDAGDGRGPCLVAGGWFDQLGDNTPVDQVARWVDGHWEELPGCPLNQVVDLISFDDGSGPALFAVSEAPGGIGFMAKWDGKVWQPMGNFDLPASCLYVHDDGTGPALYVGGRFRLAGGVQVNKIARWDGDSWSALAGGISTSSGPSVEAMCAAEINGRQVLVVGGAFHNAGTVPAENIAQWDGKAWSALPNSEFDSSVRAVLVHDDGTSSALYAAGAFTSVSGQIRNKITKWNGDGWDPIGFGLAVTGGGAGVECLVSFSPDGGRGLYAGGDNQFVCLDTDCDPQLDSRGIARWFTCVSAPEVLVPPDSQSAPVGSLVTLSVQATGGDLRYRWQRDGVPLNDNALRTGVGTNRLTIFSASGADEGIYEALVENDAGVEISVPATITIVPDCPADITGGDGVVGIDDLLAVISAWGPCPTPPATCSANIAISGASATSVDIDDLLAVISAWGPCP